MPMTQECPSCTVEVPASAKFCPECGVSFGGLDTDLTGRTLAGKYEIQKKIGEGSMGQIYLAMHLGLEKRVAIKVLHRDVELGIEASQRFRREGIAAGQIRHRNAIEVFDFDTTKEGLTFLAMEFVEGRDLRQFIDEEGALPFEDAEAIILQVLAALKAAHALGIVHRDLKPANVMLADDSERLKVKVLDFGLSKLVHRKIEASLTTIPGRIIGTPLYMAPEQSSGEEADARADLYAIGLIFYELLVGERPFQGKTLTELLYAQATQPVPDIFEMAAHPQPDHLGAFFEKALDRAKDDRFQSAEEMVAALLGEVEITPALDTRRGAAAAEPRRARRRAADQPQESGSKGLLMGVGAALLLGAVGFGVMQMTGGGGEKETSGGGQAAVAQATDPSAPRLRRRPPRAMSDGSRRYLRSLEEARQALAEGDANRAVAKAQAAFDSPLRDPEAFLVRGLALRATGDKKNAAKDLADALSGDPTFDEARMELGWTELMNSDSAGVLGQAEALFQEVRDTSPSHADALAGLGVIAERREDAEAARDLYSRAIEANSECWRALVGKGRLEIAEGEFALAEDTFSQAKRWSPRSVEALVGLGEASLGTGSDDEAIRNFSLALEYGGPSLAAKRGLCAAYFRQERYDDARDELRDALSTSGDDRALGLFQTVAQFRAEELTAIRDQLSDIDRRDPDAARLYELRAGVELLLGEPGKAALSATKAVRSAGAGVGSAGASYFLGVSRFQLGEYEEAEGPLRQAVTIDDHLTDAYFLLGVLGRDFLADGSNALEDLIRYYELGGKDPRAEVWIEELKQGG